MAMTSTGHFIFEVKENTGKLGVIITHYLSVPGRHMSCHVINLINQHHKERMNFNKFFFTIVSITIFLINNV